MGYGTSTLHQEANGDVLNYAPAYKKSLGDGTTVASQMDVNSNDELPSSAT